MVKVSGSSRTGRPLTSPTKLLTPGSVGIGHVVHVAVLRGVHVSPYTPEADGSTMVPKTCMFTPDEHFIVDRHPEHSSVVFAAGLSGHGFKFTSALGKILAEMTLDGQPSVNVDFLGLNRPGLKI